MKNNVNRLEGTVDVVKYTGGNGYIILDLLTENEIVTVLGTLGEIMCGERLVVHGKYIDDAKFGWEFKATSCERKLPNTSEDIERYLASGIIKGIGESMAKKIVDTFGSRVFEIIREHPERLTEVKGISKAKAMGISKTFAKMFHMKEVLEFLLPYNVGVPIANKAFKKWEFATVETIKKNPFLLCYDNINLPFDMADRIAQSLGFKYNCYERISAGFFDVLSNALLDGNTCLFEETFLTLSQRRLNVSMDDVVESYLKASEENLVIPWKCSEDGRKYVYLKPYFESERCIAIKIHSMTQNQPKELTPHPEMIQALEKLTGIVYNTRQQDAINMAVNSNFMVLTGGPGTGKTTTLNGIITILESQGLKVKVTAPTGRATKRITEVTGHEAMTIHRLLEVTFDEDGNQSFSHNRLNPLKCDAIIVDEMSMVDTLLFDSLLQALDVKCKVILVGDSDQLPSVSAGNVLKDLISSERLNTIVLDEIFRQAQESAIVMNAHKVIKGEYPNIYLKDNDFFFFQRLDYRSAQATILELWKDRLPKAYNYFPLEDIQVLCPSKKGTLGTVTLNQLMQNAINPPQPKEREVKNGTYTFRLGDKVMQTKNNYDVIWQREDDTTGTGIYNGDMGRIVKIGTSSILIDFDGRIVQYNKDMLDQLDLAYAITIHKSQGSEFNVVIMPILNNFRMLSYRNLLYTGITRAKKLLIVVGSTNELFNMVDNDRQTLRNSNLWAMIRHEFKES